MKGRPKGRASIKDVARAADVSPTTVSRVLRDADYPVNPALRERVLRAARELDYTPNMLGRMFKSNRNQELGIIIPTVVNPFYTQIVMGMETEARQGEYGVLLCNTLRSAKLENNALRSLFEKRILGVAIASVTEDHALIRKLQRDGLKVVAIDQELRDVEGCAKVGFDYKRAGMLAAQNLIQSGHRNTAYLSSPLNKQSRAELLEGFRMGHLAHGRTLAPENILIDDSEDEYPEGIYELECARRLAQRLVRMHSRPDGVFVTNDMIAMGLLSALPERGIRVPEDVSVVGFDNILFSAMVSPPLTTIEQPALEIGRRAYRMLLQMLEGEGGPADVTLEPRWIERRSVKDRR